jgi:hypothetical protein
VGGRTVTGLEHSVSIRRRGTAVAALVCALVTVCAVPTPAAADSRRFGDRVRDTSAPADITRVTVDNGPRIVVTVRHRNLRFDTGAPAALRVAYDTGRRFAGPEFFLRVIYQTDAGSRLRHARGWGRLDGPATSCTGERVRVSAVRNVTTVSVPASCLGAPRRVRVHIRLNPRAGGGRVDVAPRARTMGPWTHR